MQIALIRWFANVGTRRLFAADLVFVCFAFLCAGTRFLVLILVFQLGFGLLSLFVKDVLLYLDCLDHFNLGYELVASYCMMLDIFVL